MNELLNENTFNGKPVWRNVIAVILGVIGVYFLAHAWAYHMVVQLVTVPQDDWVNPLDKVNVPVTPDYPNMFCDVLCTVETTMIHQLGLLRERFGAEYCGEEGEKKDVG